MREFYDRLGDAEWDRLETTVRGRVSFEVHRRFLRHYVKSGDRVLEIGSGPGRFTFELAAAGARIVVTDFSPVQLELHAQHLRGTEAETAVESRELLDICDTSRYADSTFDLVLVYGGPLSYAFEHDQSALEGLFRIAKPTGFVVGSVMSLLGSWRYFLRGVVDDANLAGAAAIDLILETGDLRHFGSAHVCQMYKATDMARLVELSGGEVLALSASNWASLGDADALRELEADPERWRRFVDHEVNLCREPGAVDGGTHLLFAATRR